MIKFWSYKRELNRYKGKLNSQINKSLKSGNIFFGEQLSSFEKKFIKKNKSKYGIAVGSGTDALLIALTALGIKKGDQVITASNTAIPTITAIINSGATPKLVDVGDDFLIDVKKIQKEINSKTKAIIPVHLYGQSCNMSEITKIAKRNKIEIIEDCAQSQGAKFKNKYTGTFGRFGCFSFYPTKILGAYGDGGFILANTFEDYKKIKRLRFYGIETIDNKNKFYNKYYSNENGFNSRLDEIQSSILNFKLTKVDDFINKRRKLVKIYLKELKETSLKLPIENKNCKHVYHLFTVYHKKAKLIIKKLYDSNIETRIIYPFPIHLMKAYKNFKFKKNKLRKSEIFSKGIICLPLYPELKIKEVKYICSKIKNILNKI